MRAVAASVAVNELFLSGKIDLTKFTTQME